MDHNQQSGFPAQRPAHTRSSTRMGEFRYHPTQNHGHVPSSNAVRNAFPAPHPQYPRLYPYMEGNNVFTPSNVMFPPPDIPYSHPQESITHLPFTLLLDYLCQFHLILSILRLAPVAHLPTRSMEVIIHCNQQMVLVHRSPSIYAPTPLVKL
jgi:hypothetical protein